MESALASIDEAGSAINDDEKELVGPPGDSKSKGDESGEQASDEEEEEEGEEGEEEEEEVEEEEEDEEEEEVKLIVC